VSGLRKGTEDKGDRGLKSPLLTLLYLRGTKGEGEIDSKCLGEYLRSGGERKKKRQPDTSSQCTVS